MAEPQAGSAGSAPASQSTEQVQQANQAAAANGSAPLDANQSANTTANTSGSEPEGALGEKGKQEVISLRKRAQGAEQDAAYWRGLAEGRSHQTQDRQSPAAQPDGPPAPPDPAKYENWEDFEKAKDDHLISKAKWEIRQEQRQQSVVQRVMGNKNRFSQNLQKADPEVERAIRTAPAPTDAMADAILESESSVEIAYHLATHPDDYTRIMSLPSAYAQAKEIGKIEAKISAASSPALVQHISQAPEPLKPVGGSSGSQPVDLEKIPIDDFMKQRNHTQYGRR